MLWIVLAAPLVLAVVALLVAFGRQSATDLGAVSARWVAEHRIDAA